jgi:hypothetical protein
LVESCTMNDARVDAVGSSSSNLYEFAERFNSVDEYKNGTCTVRTKYSLLGGIWIYFFGNSFYQKTEEGYVRINASYVQFPCQQEGS